MGVHETNEHTRFHRRIDELRRRAAVLAKAKPSDPLALEDALRELRGTLEELQVAQEELRQQNETLRESQASLKVERERYHSLFNFAPDPYLVTDLDGTILEANAAAASLAGRPRHYLVGKPLLVLVRGENRRLFRNLRECARPGAPVVWEFEVGPHDGPSIWVEARVQPFTQEGRTVLRWILRDLTERHAAQEALQRASREVPASCSTTPERPSGPPAARRSG